MQSHPLNSTPLKPEIQAVLDIAEMQGVPVWYEHGLFMMKKIELKESPPTGRGFSENLGTQNLDTILRWIEEYKKWNPDESN
jgi:hypothetical protein